MSNGLYISMENVTSGRRNMKTVEYVRDMPGTTLATVDGTPQGITGSLKDALEIPRDTNGRWAISCVKIPDGFRLVTPEDRKTSKPEDTYYLTEGGGWSTAGKYGWHPDNAYIVPIKEQIDVQVTVNGKPIDPDTLSDKSWMALKG